MRAEPRASWESGIMGIFGALTTAVSGLRAQSFALENISGNIANSQTTGFKRNDTSFADLVGDDGLPTAQRSGSVQSLSRSTNSIQGGIERSETSTHMSINGDGYFILGEKTGTANGQPVFAAESLYSRRGDFEIDADGFLVNGAGYFLKALKIDQNTGNPSSSLPEMIQLTNDFLPARKTTQIEYRANLSLYPKTANADATIPGSELLPTTPDFSTSVTADDQTVFLNRTVSGGAVTVYDSNGSPVNVQFRWGKSSNSPPQWSMFYLSDANATGSAVAWRNTGQVYEFDSSGKLTPVIQSVTLAGLSVNGTPVGDIVLRHGTNGITQFANNAGNAQVTALSQDGYAAGDVLGVSVNDGGRIVANYSNGQTLEVARVVLAGFTGQNALQKVDGGAFRASLDSGEPILGTTGKISGSSLESSNTDIASEFSKLIVTQQAYSANTRIVSTANDMMQEVLNMKR